jgi:hypothetical protein
MKNTFLGALLVTLPGPFTHGRRLADVALMRSRGQQPFGSFPFH